MYVSGPTCFCPGLTGSEIVNITQPSFLLHIYNTAGNRKTLFHEFFRQAVLLGLKSLSCTVGWCIFNKEKHTGQNTTDFKCRCKSGWLDVLLFSQFRQSFFHAARLRSQWWIMRRIEMEANTMSTDNTEGGRTHSHSILYAVSTWKDKTAEHIGLVKLHQNNLFKLSMNSRN